MNPNLEQIKFLIGKWQTDSGCGKFPAMEPFSYCEELHLQAIGSKPVLSYNSKSWHPVTKQPMHCETGFIKIKPDSNEISLMVSHNFGLTTIEEGNVIANNMVKVKSTNIGRCSFNKEPSVTEIAREIKLLPEDGKLQVTTYMATTKTAELQEHLVAVYNKIE